MSTSTPDPNGAPTSEAETEALQRLGIGPNGTDLKPSSPVAVETVTPRTDAVIQALVDSVPEDERTGHWVDIPGFGEALLKHANALERELTQAKSEVERLKGELDEAVRKWTDRDFKILELNSALQDAANDFNRQDRALATAKAQLAEVEAINAKYRELAYQLMPACDGMPGAYARFQILGAERDALRSRLVEAERENTSLTQWKSEASKVLNDLNLQEIGKVIESLLGSDIAPQILLGIKELIRQRDAAFAWITRHLFHSHRIKAQDVIAAIQRKP